jgi:hypothetical protein
VVKREPRATPEQKAAPNTTPMPECHWIMNRRRNRIKYMLSKQDGLDLFCSYLAYSGMSFRFSGFERDVRIGGFKDVNLFRSAIKCLESAEICLRADFRDEDFSVLIYRAHAFKNDKGQIYFKPCAPAETLPVVDVSAEVTK